MSDLVAILSFYRALARFAVSGALPDEAAMMAQPEREIVLGRFLSPAERDALAKVPACDRQLRLRKGALRFQAWEAANPDIAALLRRKAERQVFDRASYA
ncbi:hypothetical protein [Tropicimonas aquimaris]|uniref:Uncharacterized protein n=1 Tax=Tropicimonas aquimaris TaxID=914152 RepID=A0ABW3IPM2_9RHOB